MVVLVSVDSDDNLDSTTTFTTHNSYHFHLLEGWRAGQVSGQDCDGA